MILLFTSYYQDKDSVRNNELKSCLNNNIKNPYIDKIYLLSEENILVNSPKVIKIKLEGRPKFSDFFNLINSTTIGQDISIIANADIHFDDTLRHVLQQDMSATCYALSRWDIDENGQAVLYDHPDSQDAWIFKGHLPIHGGDYC